MIDPEEVHSVIKDCLFNSQEEFSATPDDMVVSSEGILRDFVFKRDHLERHRGEVEAWLRQLPRQFRKDQGGGWSFLNSCCLENGVQWTGQHSSMEELFILGIALGLANWCLPRSMWTVFPGGMPYVVLNLEPLAGEV